MKRCLLLAVVLVACSKSNDVSTLRHEAVSVAKYYDGELDGLDRRVQSIFKRGTTIPANLPGIEEVGKRLTEARDTLIQLRGIVHPGPDGKSAVEKQADLAVAANDKKKLDVDRRADLEKLVDDTESTLEHGTMVVGDDLNSVESWIALYDQGINRAGGPMPQPPAPEQPSPPTEAPVNPPASSPNATGQVPGAAPGAPTR
jgi:hypothetical protein